MNCSRFAIWIIFTTLCTNNTPYVNSYLGINWGRLSSQRMIPSMVVDMLLQNGIKEVKLFSASHNVLEAFAGTDIGVTVTITNGALKTINDTNAARTWLRENVMAFVQNNVKIRYVSVGAEPYSLMYFNETYYEAVNVLEYVHQALLDFDLGEKIKATMNHFTDMLNGAKIPSKGDFRSDIKDLMIRTCEILSKNNAPIFLDAFPIYNAKMQFNNDTEFAFFYNNSTSGFIDGNNKYNNVFEIMYDTLVYALEKNGFPTLKIIVGQVGWPTDGIDGANIKNAERFYKGFLKFHNSEKGTPRRPGAIDAYIYNLVDENKLPIKQGAFLRHWGIFRSDGEPKFNIDFSGQGKDIKPASGKGITHMPNRWCVFNNKTVSDSARLQELFYQTCIQSDCTSLAPGGSCGNLVFPHNVSYAFNMLFQMKSQKVSARACNYDGYGVIVPHDPSTDTCKFPVEILSAEIINSNIISTLSLSPHHKLLPQLFLVSLLLTLIQVIITC